MKPSIDIRDIPIAQIEPNPDNPNEMDDDLLDALRDDISRRGFVQPILVREVDDGFRLVDGEHRWKVMGELGAETIPCVVTDDDATDADIRMLTMNRLRGQMVPVRLAHLLADLSERVEPDEITKRLGMDAAELKDLLDLAGVEQAAAPEPEPEPEAEEPETKEVVVTVVANADQARTLHALLADDDAEQVRHILRAAEVVAYNGSDEQAAPNSD